MPAFIFMVLSRPGSPTRTVFAPAGRITEIVEEYRLLGWVVVW